MKIEGGKFLITGGASQIGAHITEQLLKAGVREVVLFDNYSLGSPEAISDLLGDPRVKLVKGDILRTQELYDQLEGVSGVFATAGFLTLPLSLNPHLGVAVNVQGMLNVYDACRYRGVEKVVFSSSIAAYGEPSADIIDETTPWTWANLQPGDFSVEKIHRMIGWKAEISFEEGIRRMIAWREKEQRQAA